MNEVREDYAYNTHWRRRGMIERRGIVEKGLATRQTKDTIDHFMGGMF